VILSAWRRFLTIYQGETNAFGEAGVDVGFPLTVSFSLAPVRYGPVQQQISGGGP